MQYVGSFDIFTVAFLRELD